MTEPRIPLVVIGGGPAGLSAAWKAASEGLAPTVLEASGSVGGLARTEVHRGYRFDIGGHRFFTRFPEVDRLWRELLGDDLRPVPRRSRILYRGHFFHYPLDLPNVIAGLGPVESLHILWSYLGARLSPRPEERTFEDWVVNRFGERLYRTFFKTYTEKVWGIPCSEIQADWAAQRIRGLSLAAAVREALFGGGGAKTLIREFLYPRLGPGMAWEALSRRTGELGGRVLLGARVTGVRREGDRVVSVTATSEDGPTEMAAGQVISTMPLPDLVACLDPPPPPEVLAAASGLTHRSFLLVGLVVSRPAGFDDQWIYVHDPGVRVGRIQNFGAWSSDLVPVAGTGSIGMEYFCDRGDDLWSRNDADLVALAAAELDALGLACRDEVADGVVYRHAHAYPVYSPGYRERVETVRRFLDGLANLQSVGRNGMHRYNNMDHSMLTGLAAADRVMGRRADPWEVNREDAYLEGPGNDGGAS